MNNLDLEKYFFLQNTKDFISEGLLETNGSTVRYIFLSLRTDLINHKISFAYKYWLINESKKLYKIRFKRRNQDVL